MHPTSNEVVVVVVVLWCLCDPFLRFESLLWTMKAQKFDNDDDVFILLRRKCVKGKAERKKRFEDRRVEISPIMSHAYFLRHEPAESRMALVETRSFRKHLRFERGLIPGNDT